MSMMCWGARLSRV